MNTPASVRDHPMHPMLVGFPIALWIFSLVCDIIYYTGAHDAFWKAVAFYSIAGGIIGALLAAIPGFIDYLSLRDRAVKKVATTHMVLNLVVVALFLFNLGIRYNATPSSEMLGVALSILAIGMLFVSGWLGGTLVYKYRVGINTTRDEREIGRRAA